MTSDATGIDTQGRGIVRWNHGDEYVGLRLEDDRSPWSGEVMTSNVLLTPDEARQVIVGLQRMIAAVEKT